MKTIINKNLEVRRVGNQTALHLVNHGDWEYCPKRVWKAADVVSKNKTFRIAVDVEE